MQTLTGAQWRHLARMLGLGRVTVPTVYESIGPDFVAAPAPGFLNLGLWDERPGTVAGAPAAARRLVEALAGPLPQVGDILDVANGLGAQDVVIDRLVRPRRLVAVNLTEQQLRDGSVHLRRAGALPVVGDAVRLPVASEAVDGVISVEAAFHFPSRAAFLAEAARVLRPGGVLAFSDVTVERVPRDPGSLVAGLTALLFWGLQRRSLASAAAIVAMARRAGFADVRAERCGHRTIDPFVEFLLERLTTASDVPGPHRLAGRAMARQWRHLRQRGAIDYLLVWARRPDGVARARPRGRRLTSVLEGQAPEAFPAGDPSGR